MRIGLVPGHNQHYRPVTPAGELPLVGVAAIAHLPGSARCRVFKVKSLCLSAEPCTFG
jgi:hypothetical protein